VGECPRAKELYGGELDGNLRDRLGIVGVNVVDEGTCLEHIRRAGSQTRNTSRRLDVRERLGGPRRGCAASCRHRSPPDLATGGGPEFHELYQHLAADRARYNLTYGLRLRWSSGLRSDGLKGKNGVSLGPSESIRSADKKRRRSSRLFPRASARKPIRLG
jgi:hypothetical protein